MNPADLPTMRRPKAGGETIYHLEDQKAYRQLCEHLANEGYDFPQCLTGMDMEYGLRSVLHLRRLRDQAEITIWLDVPYDQPRVPSVSDLWGGVEWHEREAYDLLGIHYDKHPDLRRILLEDDWTIHPLQRRYDTGGYLIPDWKAKEWPDWDAIEAAKAEEKRKAAEQARKKAEAARAKAAAAKAKKVAEQQAEKETTSEQGKTAKQAQATHQKDKTAKAEPTKSSQETTNATSHKAKKDDLKRISGIGPKLEQLLNKEGVTSFQQVANLSTDDIQRINERLNFSGRIEREQWREQAKTLLEEADHDTDA